MRTQRVGFGVWLSALAAAPVVAQGTPAPASLQWTELAPGVFEARIGEPDRLTLLGAAAQPPKREALGSLPRARFPFEPGEAVARVASGKVALRFPLAEDEEIYGLGVDFKSLRRTGATLRLHVDHWGGVPGRTHAPVPLYVSSRGYAVLVDAARYVDFYVGTAVRLAAPRKPPVVDRTTGGKAWSAQPRADSVEALVPAPGARVLVFEGPTALDAVRRYNLWSGGGALPPKWGLGFMTRTPTAYTAEQALAEVAEFRRRGIPLDMLGLEPGWHDHAYPCSFEWDKTRFPDPRGFLAELERRHVRANLWFNPYVSPTSPLHARLLPFAGSHLVWNGIVPDYSLDEARAVFSDHLKRTVVDLGPAAVGGFKVDEVDGYDRWLWPDLAVFPSANDADQLRQSYGLFVQRLLFELFRRENRRTLGQVRGSNAGASPFPFVIYNDNYAFEEYVTAVANSSFAGVLWSPEVRAGDAEDMLRRVQAVCFSPLALFNGWATSTKLWTHAAVEADIRAAIRLRLRLLPYWYATFAQYHFEGTPVVRAMPLVAGFDTRAGAQEPRDQYMVGDALLVAPIAPGAKTRKLRLPAGRWFDFDTGQLAGEGPTEIEVAPTLSRIPLFVRDGALVPLLAAERQWAPAPTEVLALEVRHYGTAPGSLDLYDDDGESFDYERGEHSRTRLAAARDASGEWRGSVQPDPTGRKWSYGAVTWRFMTAPERPAPGTGSNP
ncbi:MAG TPA: TIM-barrel domain-containing protein [Vicinamibacteria bacterium]